MGTLIPIDLDPISFFTHPVLRAPTIGCMLVGFTSGLIGVFAFLRKESLIGESLSHASYPGITLAILSVASSPFFTPHSLGTLLVVLFFAFLSALAGYLAISFLTKKLHLSKDASLCFVLSSFFGLGVLISSHIQFTHSSFYKLTQGYLFGQSATITDTHVYIYLFLLFCCITFIIAFFKEMQAITFDPEFAKTSGISTKFVQAIFYPLVALTIVGGVKTVGVVLMSGMLIAPVSAARQFTKTLKNLLVLSAFFGTLCGFIGNYLATILSYKYSGAVYGSFPTGPIIILTATLLCLLSLFFAPERGYLSRKIRKIQFRWHCLQENLLKALWKSPNDQVNRAEIKRYFDHSNTLLSLALWQLKNNNNLVKVGDNNFSLTKQGKAKAQNIIRLHRLWELYLTSYIGVESERVHRSAEEMEHIITPEMEEKLTALLNDPKLDPHMQPIPPHQDIPNSEET